MKQEETMKMATEEEYMKFIKEKVEKRLMVAVTASFKNDNKFKKFIINKTEFLDQNYTREISVGQRIWHILHNNQEIVLCQECNKQVGFHGFRLGYGIACSYKCGAGPIAKEKFIQTCIKTLGVSNPSQSPIVKEKKKETTRKNYGVDYYAQTEEFKERFKKTCTLLFGCENPFQNEEIKEKIKKHYLNLFGVEYYSQTEEWKEKFKLICLERFGVDHPQKSAEIRQKTIDTCLLLYGTETPLQNKEIQEEIIRITLEKYGVENYSSTIECREKVIATCLMLFGVENPMQVAEIAEKCFKNAKALKKYTMPSGKIVLIQGYENVTLDWLLTVFNEEDIFVGNRIIENEIGQIWYEFNGEQHRYMPDAYVKSINKVFETKSTWTFKKDLECNILKERACIKTVLNFEFVIYDKKKALISEGSILGDFDKNSI